MIERNTAESYMSTEDAREAMCALALILARLGLRGVRVAVVLLPPDLCLYLRVTAPGAPAVYLTGDTAVDEWLTWIETQHASLSAALVCAP